MIIVPPDDVNGNTATKSCCRCKKNLPLSEYYSNKSRPDGRGHICKPCLLADRKKKGQPNWRRNQLKSNFGITIEQYDEMLAAQGGTCAICGKPEKVIARSGKIRRLAVDHCHETGDIRGLLCTRCNRLLGQVGDNADWILRAIVYLGYHVNAEE